MPALGEGLEKKGGEGLDVAGANFVALTTFRSVADAVTAKLDDLALGEDVGGLDMLMDETGAVEGPEGFDDAGADLAGLFRGEGTIAQNGGEIGVGGFDKGVDDLGPVDLGLSGADDADEMFLPEIGDALPPREDLCLVEVGFDQTEDGWLPGGVAGGEEGAAAFGADEPLQGEETGYGLSFIVVPEFHKYVRSWELCKRALGEGTTKLSGRWARSRHSPPTCPLSSFSPASLTGIGGPRRRGPGLGDGSKWVTRSSAENGGG